MALTYSFSRGTHPPRRSATNNEQEKAAMDHASKRKPEAEDGMVKKLSQSDAKVTTTILTKPMIAAQWQTMPKLIKAQMTLITALIKIRHQRLL